MMGANVGHVQRGTMRNCPNCGKAFDDAVSFCPTDGAKLSDSGDTTGQDVDPFVGRMVGGRYRLESRLGEGGMGTVYRALHVLMEKPVAVKILRGELAVDETAVARFQREAKGASRIEHENCVSVTDFGREDDGVLWLIMEHLEGETLWDVIQEDGPLSKRRTLDIGLQVARALVAAHSVGVVHRDLKPENVMVVQRPDRRDHVKVLDFGLAKLLHADGERGTALTRAGSVFGTPRYMSPEQAEGRPADQRSDLYSFGVLLYEMITGTLPFDDESVVALLNRHVSETPERPSERLSGVRDVDPRLEAVIMRCLDKAPEDRFPDATSLLQALEALAPRGRASSGPRPSMVTGELVAAAVQTGPPRRVVFGLGITLGAIAVAGAILMLTDDRQPDATPPTSHAASVARQAVPPPPAGVTPPTPEPAPAPPPTPDEDKTDGDEKADDPPRAARTPAAPKRTARAKRRTRGRATSRRAQAPPKAAPTQPASQPPSSVKISPEDRRPSLPGVGAKRADLSQATPQAPTRPKIKPVTVKPAAPTPPIPERAPATPAINPKAAPSPGPKLTGDPYTDGLAYLRRGDVARAETTLIKGVRAKPTEARLHMALTDVYLRKGDLRYAEFAARKALKIAPQSVDALTRLGRVQYKKGQRRPALATFRTILQLKPGDRTALKYIEKLQ